MFMIPWYGWVGILAAGGWLVKETGDLMDGTAKVGRIVVIGGVAYVAFKAVTK